MRTVALAVALLSLLGGPFARAETDLLGRELLVTDPGSPARRRIVVVARQTNAGVPAVSDPTAGGATLTIVANGGASTSETYVLDAAGWTALGTTGFRYAGPTGVDGDPVRRVTLKRSAAGTVVLKIVVSGAIGSQPVTVVPPNPGSEGGASLAVSSGDTYCVVLGGAAGGTVSRDTAQQWRIVRAVTTAGCPSTSTTTTTATVTTTTATTMSSTSTVSTTTTITTFPCLPDGTYNTPLAYDHPCCSGGTCQPVAPGTCGCGPACDTHPFPMCPASGLCYLVGGPPQPNMGCMAIRVVTDVVMDECGCPPPMTCDPPCPCPDGQVCQFDLATNTCGCVPL